MCQCSSIKPIDSREIPVCVLKKILYNIAFLLKKVDERQEKLTLVPSFIEIGRVTITCCQKDHSPTEQLLEKSLQDRSISNIGYLKLVQIQESQSFRPSRGYCYQRIKASFSSF